MYTTSSCCKERSCHHVSCECPRDWGNEASAGGIGGKAGHKSETKGPLRSARGLAGRIGEEVANARTGGSPGKDSICSDRHFGAILWESKFDFGGGLLIAWKGYLDHQQIKKIFSCAS